MRIYTVHLVPGRVPPDPVLIKEGFNWLAFVFGPLWALSHRMWWMALILLGLMAGLSLLLGLMGMGPEVQSAASLGLAVIIGGMANDWRRAYLARRGFAERGLVGAGDKEAALFRYLEVARTHRMPAP